MPRPRQQVIDALKESPDYEKQFIDNIFCIMVHNYIFTGNLKMLRFECKRIIETIEKY